MNGNEIATGLCRCGCGRTTTVHRGVSRQFIAGHNGGHQKPLRGGWVEGVVGFLRLPRGLVSRVDADIYPSLIDRNWYVFRTGGKSYAWSQKVRDGVTTHVLLHRLITKAPRGMVVDHISGDTLDNRRQNLRVCTQGENVRNRCVVPSKTSRFKGVSFYGGRFHAEITVNYQKIKLGAFVFEREAGEAYNAAALKHHGEYARLNDVEAA